MTSVPSGLEPDYSSLKGISLPILEEIQDMVLCHLGRRDLTNEIKEMRYYSSSFVNVSRYKLSLDLPLSELVQFIPAFSRSPGYGNTPHSMRLKKELETKASQILGLLDFSIPPPQMCSLGTRMRCLVKPPSRDDWLENNETERGFQGVRLAKSSTLNTHSSIKTICTLCFITIMGVSIISSNSYMGIDVYQWR